MGTIVWLFLIISIIALITTAKTTVELCSNCDSCYALLGYTTYTELKVSEVASLFNVDPLSILASNPTLISYRDVVEDHVLSSQLFLLIPIKCSCVGGIRKSVSTRYKIRPFDDFILILNRYSGLVSADQLRQANKIEDPGSLHVEENLVVPLPCTCFNGTFNSTMPAIYLSYVVKEVDTLVGIANRFLVTLDILTSVNHMPITVGDILAVPLGACTSSFPRCATDYGLILRYGSYAITANHCLQCSCGPGNHNLYCMPASLAVSCSSMPCTNSNLMLGNYTMQQSSAGCNITYCGYGGFVNGTIVTTLSTYFYPYECVAPTLPHLIDPPSLLPLPAPQSDDSVCALALAPAPAPQSNDSVFAPPMAPQSVPPPPPQSPPPPPIMSQSTDSTGKHPSNRPSIRRTSSYILTLLLLVVIILMLCICFGRQKNYFFICSRTGSVSCNHAK